MSFQIDVPELNDYLNPPKPARADKPSGCSIKEFFRREQEKPRHLRSNSCMIVCRCPECVANQPIC